MSRPTLTVTRGGRDGVATPPVPPASDTGRTTRERVILALIPVAARAELQNPQQMVEKAKVLCDYIQHGSTRDTP